MGRTYADSRLEGPPRNPLTDLGSVGSPKVTVGVTLTGRVGEFHGRDRVGVGRRETGVDGAPLRQVAVVLTLGVTGEVGRLSGRPGVGPDGEEVAAEGEGVPTEVRAPAGRRVVGEVSRTSEGEDPSNTPYSNPECLQTAVLVLDVANGVVRGQTKRRTEDPCRSIVVRRSEKRPCVTHPPSRNPETGDSLGNELPTSGNLTVSTIWVINVFDGHTVRIPMSLGRDGNHTLGQPPSSHYWEVTPTCHLPTARSWSLPKDLLHCDPCLGPLFRSVTWRTTRVGIGEVGRGTPTVYLDDVNTCGRHPCST